jgi:CrcB protein
VSVIINCLCVGAGGFVGSVCRYLLGQLPWPASGAGAFPACTFIINIVGSFLIGAVVALVLAGALGAGSPAQLFLQAGVCGGFTTFSTFSSEALTLLEGGHPALFALYAVASVALGIAACALGMHLAAKPFFN